MGCCKKKRKGDKERRVVGQNSPMADDEESDVHSEGGERESAWRRFLAFFGIRRRKAKGAAGSIQPLELRSCTIPAVSHTTYYDAGPSAITTIASKKPPAASRKPLSVKPAPAHPPASHSPDTPATPATPDKPVHVQPKKPEAVVARPPEPVLMSYKDEGTFKTARVNHCIGPSRIPSPQVQGTARTTGRTAGATAASTALRTAAATTAPGTSYQVASAVTPSCPAPTLDASRPTAPASAPTPE